jgi:hypothetical protein
MISDAHPARAFFLALTGITCLKSWSATDDWFEKSTQVQRHLTTHVTFAAYRKWHHSFGTQDAIEAERVELHSQPNESHHDRLRLQV